VVATLVGIGAVAVVATAQDPDADDEVEEKPEQREEWNEKNERLSHGCPRDREEDDASNQRIL
jgi:hypothetical protein